VAAPGYPGRPQGGLAVEGVEDARQVGCLVFHAGTARRPGDGRLVTAGGRVLGVTALGPDLASARTRAYDGVGRISFTGMHHRTDIAA